MLDLDTGRVEAGGRKFGSVLKSCYVHIVFIAEQHTILSRSDFRCCSAPPCLARRGCSWSPALRCGSDLNGRGRGTWNITAKR